MPGGAHRVQGSGFRVGGVGFKDFRLTLRVGYVATNPYQLLLVTIKSCREGLATPTLARRGCPGTTLDKKRNGPRT